MTSLKDKVSVITVVYNGKSFIEETIKSVIAQTYQPLEYIIIDGGSTDGTIDIIKKYADTIGYWCSEPDNGIYDAMNKAIDKTTGNWINFMNAGDYFYTPDAVEKIFSSDTDLSPYAAIYGDAEFRLKNIAYINEAGDECDSNGFMPFSHQAAFVRTEVLKSAKFDLKYKITADTAFFLRLIKEGKQLKRIPVVVCSYDAQQGLSVDNEIKRCEELIAMQVAFNKVNADAPYFKKYLRNARIKQYLRTIIPDSIWIKLRERNIKKTKGNDFKYIGKHG